MLPMLLGDVVRMSALIGPLVVPARQTSTKENAIVFGRRGARLPDHGLQSRQDDSQIARYGSVPVQPAPISLHGLPPENLTHAECLNFAVVAIGAEPLRDREVRRRPSAQSPAKRVAASASATIDGSWAINSW